MIDFFHSMRPNLDIHYSGESTNDSILTFILNRERGEHIESICQLTSTFVNDPYFSKNIC